MSAYELTYYTKLKEKLKALYKKLNKLLSLSVNMSFSINWNLEQEFAPPYLSKEKDEKRIDRNSVKPINGFRTDSKFGSFVVSFKNPTLSCMVTAIFFLRVTSLRRESSLSFLYNSLGNNYCRRVFLLAP